MKTEKLLIKTNKRAVLRSTPKEETLTAGKIKTPVKNIFSKASGKATPHTQFLRIKKSLEEVELIEAGIIKPKSLDEVLNEL